MSGAKCQKCGLMQIPRPACKSCGAPLASKVPHYAGATASAAASSAPAAPPRQGPIYMREDPPPMALIQTAPPVAPRAPTPAPPAPMARKAPPSRAEHPPPHINQEMIAYPGGSDGQAHQLFFHGTGGSLFGIHIVNMLLTILTLGIYYFWGKTKVRNYLWSQTDFAGDRFAYHGTGKELLIGFLKAVVVFGVPFIGLIIVPEFLDLGEIVKGATTFLFYGMVMVVVPLAMVGARRYRYSRTSWRGIFFSFRGSAKEFAQIFIGGSILSMLTLGLYYPFFEVKKHAFMVSHSYFGNQQFHFDGQGRDLFKSYLLTLLLLLPTLGMYWFWFEAKKQRYLWANTTIGGARFCSTVTGGGLLLLTIGNFFLTILTFGLGLPWVAVRNARFLCRHLSVEGPLELGAIEQEAQVATATGEGLASFLDMDSGFDFG